MRSLKLCIAITSIGFPKVSLTSRSHTGQWSRRDEAKSCVFLTHCYPFEFKTMICTYGHAHSYNAFKKFHIYFRRVAYWLTYFSLRNKLNKRVFLRCSSVKLYTLMLVTLTLTDCQGHRSVWGNKFVFPLCMTVNWQFAFLSCWILTTCMYIVFACMKVH